VSRPIDEGVQFLRNNDEILRLIIDRIGPCYLSPSADFFDDLIGSIISQQLSKKAATAIYTKLIEKLGKLNPKVIKEATLQDLRDVGISFQKVHSIKSLANYYDSHRNEFKNLTSKNDDEVIDFLIKIKGIGHWTAQMFLIFTLNRLNVLPLDDVGFRRGFIKNFTVDDGNEVTKAIIERSKRWGNFKAIAAWYLWKDIDGQG